MENKRLKRNRREVRREGLNKEIKEKLKVSGKGKKIRVKMTRKNRIRIEKMRKKK